eukprot:scaffold46783_cov51-Phaeocystis_antarctica.AAC.3
MEEFHRPRCLMRCSALTTPKAAAKSVAPPMRKDLPPNLASSSPSAAAISCASLFVSVVRQASHDWPRLAARVKSALNAGAPSTRPTAGGSWPKRCRIASTTAS